MNPWVLAGLAFNITIIVMAITWLIARRLDKASYGDVGWSYSFAILALTFAATGGGDPARKWVFAGMVTIWSLRLGTHLLARVASQPEDPRYQELRDQFPKRPWFMFFGFFQLQAMLAVLLSLPFLSVFSDRSSGFSPWQIAGVAVWVLALLGESLADAQLHAFRRDPENRQSVCARGLWRYSRHPNYFFEWLIWVGYALYAGSSPGGWSNLLGVALMFLLLRTVTGVPVAEAQSLKSRGDAYRDYQRRTPIFFPWLPR